ncbi:hypothetical protein BDZ91DRAFT_710100 [Kalaharituber pfeilii]|nr:hypothetical protein BDZ91DRAFT_710100 [Kalaharituber pfeilii]
MSSPVVLRPILRTPSNPVSRPSILPSTAIITIFLHPITHIRSANLLRRPKRPWLNDQLVILSDGSAYRQLTTSPKGIIRSTKDVRNHPLWNPSIHRLVDVEEDEAGKLRAFRERFGRLWDNKELLEKEKEDAQKAAKAAGAENAAAAPVTVDEGMVVEDNLMDLISKGYTGQQKPKKKKGK